MHNALRSARQPSLNAFSLSNSNSHITRSSPPSIIRFVRAQSGDMDHPKKQNDPQSKPGDTMSSFGEGYATRSDEEGFGGVYGGNQYIGKKEGEEKIVDHEFDHSQGSEVKETEKARHQTHIGT